jgi:hypothetical protein
MDCWSTKIELNQLILHRYRNGRHPILHPQFHQDVANDISPWKDQPQPFGDLGIVQPCHHQFEPVRAPLDALFLLPTRA